MCCIADIAASLTASKTKAEKLYVCDVFVWRLLNEAQGSLLDDEHLLITLQTSKTTSQDIKEQLETAEETEEQIDMAREVITFSSLSLCTFLSHLLS